MANTLPLATSSDTLQATMRTIQADGRGIALVLDRRGGLYAVVTDGDLRRAILAGMGLQTTIAELLDSHSWRVPVTAPVGTETAVLVGIMRDAGVRQLPLLDDSGRVADLATLDRLVAEPAVQAVLMAGGRGERLRPLTDTCPKPMLPVGGRPLLEWTIGRLRDAGIGRVHLVVRYLAEQIVEHFGDGDGLGVDICYVLEQEPMGTAGALGTVESGAGPLLVANADLLTTIDYRAFIAYHREQGADLTMAVKREEWPIKSGVVDVEGAKVVGLIEKPIAGLLVNAGIYVVEPYVAQYIRQPCGMPDVVNALLRMGRPVAAFPLVEGESWVDVGTVDDYERVREVAST